MINDNIIEVKELDFSYDRVLVLEKITLSIAKGEFVGIFGPNGGGKTTFLKVLMGFLKPTKGEVLIFGKTPKLSRTQISYVPQAMRFDRQFPISVLEVVMMGCLSNAHSARERARAALEKVGLLDKAPLPFGTLSGGQAQRVLIARALVSEPEILLLDEPTANIDPEAEREIYELLTNLKGSMTILMVTHDLEAILSLAERLFCFHRQAFSLLPKEACDHYTVGLYHHKPIKLP